MARTSAPFVENGLTSTMVEDTDRATITPTAPMSPASRNGTASEMATPMIAVDDANADTTPPM